MSEPVDAVDSVKSNKPAAPSDDNKSIDALLGQSGGVVSKYSYAMIVLYVLNKVGLEHQQQVMQTRSQLMDVMTRMQNDFTTISEYLSQVQNNSYSSGSSWAYGGGDGSEGGWSTQGLNSYNGLNSSFYDLTGNYNIQHGGIGLISGGSLTSVTDSVSAQFKTSTQGFLNAVNDLFYSSKSGTGLTVSDISKIANPFGGKDFDMTSTWDALSAKDGPFASFNYGTNSVISSNPTDHPSLMQQYMYYQAQMQVNSGSAGTVNGANGDISKIVDFNPNDANSDPLEQTFIQLLTALNTNVSVNRDGSAGGNSVVDKDLGGDTFLSLIASGQVNCTLQAGEGSGPDGAFRINQVKPGLYLAVSMMAFDYFWSKNPNASTTAPYVHFTGSGEVNDNNSALKGAASMDPLSNLYMTNNSVQTNVGQQTSQGNNNFQQDVNVAGQLSNVGQNVQKSFFDGIDTMNRNFRSS